LGKIKYFTLPNLATLWYNLVSKVVCEIKNKKEVTSSFHNCSVLSQTTFHYSIGGDKVTKPVITKVLDAYNRLTIPKETLQAVGISPGDLVAISLDESPDGLPALVLSHYTPGCSLCGQTVYAGHFIEFQGKRICNTCLQNLKEK
jgi:bifunctional DNA-binding transcriptional regulator/antitoxin component of YhaV-PrlF toxin-antitoxin module